MTITITLEHYDITSASPEDMVAVATTLQKFAKNTKYVKEVAKVQPKSIANIEDVEEAKAEEKTVRENPSKTEIKNSAEESKPSKTPAERARIEGEIKRLAMQGKEKNLTKKIKSILDEYGVEKLGDVPDDKIEELLERVRAL